MNHQDRPSGADLAAGESVALTFAELAKRLGITVASAKARARRGRWHRSVGNDGRTRVQVPVEILDRDSPAPSAKRQHHREPEDDLLISELRRQAEWLRGEIERQRVEHQAVVTRLQTERDHERSEHRQQVERFQAELDRVRAEQAALIEHQRHEHNQLRADHAAEINRLQQAIDRLTVPWWRCWFKG